MFHFTGVRRRLRASFRRVAHSLRFTGIEGQLYPNSEPRKAHCFIVPAQWRSSTLSRPFPSRRPPRPPASASRRPSPPSRPPPGSRLRLPRGFHRRGEAEQKGSHDSGACHPTLRARKRAASTSRRRVSAPRVGRVPRMRILGFACSAPARRRCVASSDAGATRRGEKPRP